MPAVVMRVVSFTAFTVRLGVASDPVSSFIRCSTSSNSGEVQRREAHERRVQTMRSTTRTGRSTKFFRRSRIALTARNGVRRIHRIATMTRATSTMGPNST